MGLFSDITNPLFDKALEMALDVSSRLAPACISLIVTGMTLMVLFYGLQLLRGDAQAPVMQFVWKVFKITLIIGILYGYQLGDTDIVRGAWQLEDDFAKVILKSKDAMTAVDAATGPIYAFFAGIVIYAIATVTDTGNGGAFPAFLMALMLLCFVVLGGGALALCVFYIVLGKIGLGIVLGLGPLFIAGLAFEPTARYFQSWMSTVINFTLLPAVATLMLVFVTTAQKAAFTSTADIVLIGPFVGLFVASLFGLVTLLMMMEVPRMVSTLMQAADVSGTVMQYATAKAVYSAPWLSSANERSSNDQGNSNNQAAQQAGAAAYQARPQGR